MSLRTRLLLALGVVALVALLAADVATYSALRSFLYGRVDQQLQGAHRGLVALVDARSGPGPGPHPFGPGPGPPLGDADLNQLLPGGYVQTRDAANRISVPPPTGAYVAPGRRATPRLPSKITGLKASDEPGELVRYFTVPSTTAGGTQFRVRVSTLRDGGQLIAALPLNGVSGTLNRLVNIELAVTSGALVAAVLLGWWLVHVGLRPLRRIEDTAEAIAEGDLDRRVPGDTSRTEIGRLARVLNTMLTRIQDAFAQRDATEARLRRFVADASHELRTPVAAVAAYAELFERGASERPGDLARVMAGIRTETGRMGHLVDDLLLLARLDQGRPLEREPTELVGIAAQAVDAARAVGPSWPVTVEATHPVEIDGDESRLRQVIDNLLANVRAHTPPGTSAVVRVDDDGGDALITVIDDGPGLAEQDAGRVFERFYRVDASRSRQSGGAGLGLAIVQAIVTAHGGRVTVGTAPGQGATFTVRLPGLRRAPEAAEAAEAAELHGASQQPHSSVPGDGRTLES
jgi:two-component system, OmpR family, sensor kinase